MNKEFIKQYQNAITFFRNKYDICDYKMKLIEDTYNSLNQYYSTANKCEAHILTVKNLCRNMQREAISNILKALEVEVESFSKFYKDLTYYIYCKEVYCYLSEIEDEDLIDIKEIEYALSPDTQGEYFIITFKENCETTELKIDDYFEEIKADDLILFNSPYLKL